MIVPPYNFIVFNAIKGLSAFYGTHPWHWYLTQGLPMNLGLLLPFYLLGIRNALKWRSFLPHLLSWPTMLLLSLVAHKENRFLAAVMPLCYIAVGRAISNVPVHWKKFVTCYLQLTLVIHAGLGVYLNMVHQRGVVDVVDHLHHRFASQKGIAHVYMLMPCHSTPFHSRMHLKHVRMTFVPCEPPLTYAPHPSAFLCNEATGRRNF